MDTSSTHYLCLAGALDASLKQQPIPVTIEQLTGILCCTPRNVKFILRKLEELELIAWQPGRGRGNRSLLTFRRSTEEVLEESFQELAGKGRIKAAIELISRYQVGEALKERLLTVLDKQMGFRTEQGAAAGEEVLRISRNRAMEKLDPAAVYTAFETYLLGHICSTLITYDAGSSSFQPGLAHTWESNPEHTSYLFYLRKGVRFHHGKMMTSRDVKETLQRHITLNSPAMSHFQDIQHVELESDYRIRFDLCRPNLFFLHLFSSIYMSILPYDVDFAVNPVGTGPYLVLDHSESVLVLGAFDLYYGIRPLLDRVEIWYLPHASSNIRQYQLTEANLSPLPSEENQSHNIDYPALGCRYILFNFKREGVQHKPDVRQVLQMLYNQPAMIRELGGNRIRPADSFLPWKSSGHAFTEPPLEAACSLLKAADYNGEVLTVAYRTRKEDQEEALWLQERGRKIGLQLRLHPLSEYDLADVMSHADMLIAEEVLEDDWQWGMINYFRNESNYLHDLLLEEQLQSLRHLLEPFSALPAAARTQLLEAAEDKLRSSSWVLYGCHMNKKAQLSQSLYGLQTGSFGFLDISKLWVKSGFQL
ncbi:ABC transporter substrate-binding protein [Paenibacillus sp. MMS20-IR301]|uniref:ABC transporter substrate-binding protein n=1 Tax=Paenibacillus sp. MMS20-IR301 TaxID=2895946 RepID=UPI0028E981D2|nr:ABC transporter substrate-binding protein [Paenibacillus sp. MMS20-IR301]WNS45045.1 ABC transporter substrate-binding protein [Paenibacillus sp. MMS20-IR301]